MPCAHPLRQSLAAKINARRMLDTGCVHGSIFPLVSSCPPSPTVRPASALRKNNNEVGAALASLTLSSGNSSTDSPRNSSPEESLAVLQSLGVPPETARDVLTRAGTLCVALEELGLNASDQSSSPTQGKKRDKKSRTERGSMSEANDGRSSSEDGGQEEGGEGEGPSPEEMALYDELVADRGNQEEEGYLDITLEDEADAADM